MKNKCNELQKYGEIYRISSPLLEHCVSFFVSLMLTMLAIYKVYRWEWGIGATVVPSITMKIVVFSLGTFTGINLLLIIISVIRNGLTTVYAIRKEIEYLVITRYRRGKVREEKFWTPTSQLRYYKGINKIILQDEGGSSFFHYDKQLWNAMCDIFNKTEKE